MTDHINPSLIAAMIVVGALAYRSASYIFSQIGRGDSARLAVMFSQNPVRHFVTFYVGVGTWIGMLVSTAAARRFNPVLQFFFFGSISLLWLAADLIIAVSRNSRA